MKEEAPAGTACVTPHDDTSGALRQLTPEDVAAFVADQEADEAREAVFGWAAEESEELGPAPQDTLQ